MKKTPIICPKCGTTIDPEALTRSSKRGKNASAAIEAEKAKKKKAVTEDIEIDDILVDDDDAEIETEDEGDDLIEDTSDLGDDDPALAEVIDEDA